jgi:hypothetical protein
MRPTRVLASFSVTEQRLQVLTTVGQQLAFGKDTTKDGLKPRTHRVCFTRYRDQGKAQIEVWNKSLNCILRYYNGWHFRDGDKFVFRLRKLCCCISVPKPDKSGL